MNMYLGKGGGGNGSICTGIPSQLRTILDHLCAPKTFLKKNNGTVQAQQLDLHPLVVSRVPRYVLSLEMLHEVSTVL